MQVGDLRLYLGQLGLRGGSQPRIRPAVAVPAALEQFGDLVEGEAEPLRRLDDAQCDDGFGRVEPVPAEAALRFGKQAAPLVVAQRLSVHPCCRGDLTAAQPAHDRTPALFLLISPR